LYTPDESIETSALDPSCENPAGTTPTFLNSVAASYCLTLDGCGADAGAGDGAVEVGGLPPHAVASTRRQVTRRSDMVPSSYSVRRCHGW
jgi:hypothetical protein